MANFEVVPRYPRTGAGKRRSNAASTILQQYPDLIGFYANNDGMALGVGRAVKAAGKQEQVAVFGTDGSLGRLCRRAGRGSDRDGGQLPRADR